jgi:hypothetical protein
VIKKIEAEQISVFEVKCIVDSLISTIHSRLTGYFLTTKEKTLFNILRDDV